MPPTTSGITTRRPRPRRPVRGWLTLLSVLLALGVVGMHQLSADHALVTGGHSQTGDREQDGATQPAGHAHPRSQHDSTPGDPAAGFVAEPRAWLNLPAAADCPGCGPHPLAVLCLLALALLGSLGMVRGPTSRPTGSPPDRPPPVYYHSPAPRTRSPIELSVSRT